jgi:hypothetical protein
LVDRTGDFDASVHQVVWRRGNCPDAPTDFLRLHGKGQRAAARELRSTRAATFEQRFARCAEFALEVGDEREGVRGEHPRLL